MNAAYRLANAIEKIKSSGGSNVAEAWARTLKVDVGSLEFITGAVLVYRLALEVQAAISESKMSDRATGLYLGAMATLMSICDPQTMQHHPLGSVAGMQQQIDLLYLAADALPPDGPEVNQFTIDAMKHEILDLLSSVDSLQVDAQFLSFLKHQLLLLLMALDSFSVMGIEGLSRIYGSVASEFARVASKENAQTPQNAQWFTKTRDVLKKIGQGVIWVGAVTSAVNGLLTDGSEILGLETPKSAGESADVPD